MVLLRLVEIIGEDNLDDLGTVTLYFIVSTLNIIDMDTYIKNAANTGFPIFFLKSNIMIPNNCDIKQLTEELNNIAQKNNFEYKLIETD